MIYLVKTGLISKEGMKGLGAIGMQERHKNTIMSLALLYPMPVNSADRIHVTEDHKSSPKPGCPPASKSSALEVLAHS